MHMRLALTLSLTLALLTGCAAPPPREAPLAAVKAIQRFGVVSVSAREFTRQYVGITVFGNEYETKNIVDWKLDSEYENQLGSAAETALQAKFVKVNAAPDAFLAVNQRNPGLYGTGFAGSNWPGIESVAREACQEQALDALFVLGQRRTGDFIGHTNQNLSGLGIYARRNFATIHYLAVLGLIDCKSGKMLGARTVDQQLDVSEDLARTPMANWAPGVDKQLQDQLKVFPPVLWESTLRNLLP